MKKFWIVLLSLLLSLACVMGFAACTERPDDETGGSVQPGDPDPDKPHEHNFGEWVVTIPATCTEAGEEQRTCSCGETETRTVAASGHDYVNGVCTRCGDTIAATDDSYFIFTELEDGTYSVAWDRNTDLPAEVVIPREHDEKPVTSIGSYAFEDCSGLTSITIPDSVTSIGESAFAGCHSLASIAIPEGVTSIWLGVFSGCSSLTSVVIPESVTSIFDYAFSGCSSLASITIPNGIIFISAHAFDSCGLMSITIPDSVTAIGEGAFNDCTSLTSVTIGNGVTSIGYSAFQDCSSLTSITASAGNSVYHSDGNCLIETESKTLILGCNVSVIPSDGSVASIGYRAFSGCSSLTSITIPDSVTSIGSQAFSGCSSLTSIVIPDSVTSIGGYAFGGCVSLTSITIPDSVTSIGGDTFSGCNGVIEVEGGVSYVEKWVIGFDLTVTSVSLRSDTIGIAGGVFRNSELTSIVIPNSVTSIGDFAFSYCIRLTSVTIGDGVISIGAGGFSECVSLTSITIPDSVTSIGEGAFFSCTGLTSVTIGDGVTSVGGEAFDNCVSLTSVTIPDSVTSIGNAAFRFCHITSVVFENPNGWSADGEAIPAAGLSDPATAAEYLTDTYLRDNWTRE